MPRAHVPYTGVPSEWLVSCGYVVRETCFLFLTHIVSGDLYGESQLSVLKERNTLRLSETLHPVSTAKKYIIIIIMNHESLSLLT